MIFINNNEYDEFFKRYENLNNNENTEIYNAFEIFRPEIYNAFEIFRPEIYNVDILKEIVSEFYADESEIYDELESEIIKLIDENASDYYFKSKNSYEIIKENKPYKIEYDEYNKSFSDSYSIYNLLILFDEIADAYKSEYELYKLSKNDKYFNTASAYELIEYIIYELDSKLFNLMNFKICLNISNSIITANNVFDANNEFIEYEILNILKYNNLDESVLKNLDEYDILDICYMDEIDEYEFAESNLIYMYDNNYDTEIEYINKLGMIISIKDILKLNEIISESDTNNNLIFNIENISDLFENANDSIDPDSFLYSYYDELIESLYDEFSDKYYYELYEINSKKFMFMKIESIYDLIKIVLNEFKHYNLNNSFKFSDELYELY